MNDNKKIKLIKAASEFRKWYLKDIEMFGESYWKEKLLNKFGSLNASDATWSDYYDEDLAEVFDNATVWEVAEMLVKEFK